MAQCEGDFCALMAQWQIDYHRELAIFESSCRMLMLPNRQPNSGTRMKY